jgi:hypothetical protein
MICNIAIEVSISCRAVLLPDQMRHLIAHRDIKAKIGIICDVCDEAMRCQIVLPSSVGCQSLCLRLGS